MADGKTTAQILTRNAFSSHVIHFLLHMRELIWHYCVRKPEKLQLSFFFFFFFFRFFKSWILMFATAKKYGDWGSANADLFLP